MDRFLSHDDELGRLLEDRASDLYNRLVSFDIDELGMPPHCLAYFKTSHSKRLFFSIETSAHLLYKAITLSGKKYSEVVIMDYGAGVGTLFLLAKMIGCKKVIYNDHLEEWKTSAELIANAVGVNIDLYIVGDIADCLDILEKNNIDCDIITSRNVIEHIYKLDEFYNAIARKQPKALVFSSTTANNSNPAAVVKHVLWHKKWEKVFRGKRMVMIKRQSQEISSDDLNKLAQATRGLGGEDLKKAVDNFNSTGQMPDPVIYRSNTCDPANGVWAEHLLTMKEYRALINENFFTISFEPGFWDTHYIKKYKNIAGNAFNRIISKGGKLAMRLAPFIYVIAVPRKK